MNKKFSALKINNLVDPSSRHPNYKFRAIYLIEKFNLKNDRICFTYDEIKKKSRKDIWLTEDEARLYFAYLKKKWRMKVDTFPIDDVTLDFFTEKKPEPEPEPEPVPAAEPKPEPEVYCPKPTRPLREEVKPVNDISIADYFMSSVYYAANGINISTFVTLAKQAGFNLKQKRFFEYLHEEGYLNSTEDERNVPTDKAIAEGLFRIKENTIDVSGKKRISLSAKMTGKGQIYFFKLLADNGGVI